MLRRHAAALAVLMIATAPPVRADDPPVDCTKAMATHELNFCAEQELNSADAKLNDAYQKVLAFIAKSDAEKPYDAKSWQAALRESQRAWVAFRDADCKGLIPMSWTGGTGTTGEVLGCMTSKTKDRTKDLLELYELD